MNRRVVIVHGWADDPTVGWIAWLAKQLRSQGIKVDVPVFTNPDPKAPNMDRWKQVLSDASEGADEQTVLVGHSLGCYMILDYLSQHDVSVAGIVLVAGSLPDWRPELQESLDLELVKQRAQERICIYSDDDHVVDPSRTKKLAKAINAKEILDPGKRHFAGLRGVMELPSVLEAVRGILDHLD